MPVLELRDVVSGYGRVPVLQSVSMHVAAGELVSLVGPNGAGKSTLLKTVVGLVPVWRGSVLLEGQRTNGRGTHVMPSLGVGYVPEGRLIFAEMSVAENLLVGGFASRRDKAVLRQRMEEIYGLFPRLRERRRQAAGSLSGGEQQMLAIGRGLMCGPRLLLLDEPSLGLSPAAVDILFDALTTLRGRGLTMLMVEQNAERALEISDRGYVLALGQVQAEGPGSDLLGDPQVRTVYLGEAG